MTAKRLSWLVLAITIISIALQAAGLFLPLRILAFAVLAVTIIIAALSYWQTQKNDIEIDQRFGQEQSERKAYSGRPDYSWLAQQTPPKDKA